VPASAAFVSGAAMAVSVIYKAQKASPPANRTAAPLTAHPAFDVLTEKFLSS